MNIAIRCSKYMTRCIAYTCTSAFCGTNSERMGSDTFILCYNSDLKDNWI